MRTVEVSPNASPVPPRSGLDADDASTGQGHRSMVDPSSGHSGTSIRDATKLRRMREGLAGLDPRRDVTASRGMARREHVVTPIGLSVIEDVMTSISKPALDSFGRHRRLTPQVIDAMASKFDALVDVRHAHAIVRSCDHDVAATRTQPKRVSHERLRFLVTQDDDGFALSTVQFEVTRKSLMTEVKHTTLSWTRHASERFYERADRQALPSSASIGKGLADMFATACMASVVVVGEGFSRSLPLPCQGGLLLGEVSYLPPEAWKSRAVMADNAGVSTRRSKPTHVSTGALVNGVLTWRGRTFVGPDELGPDQKAYVDAWAELLALDAVRTLNADCHGILTWSTHGLVDLRSMAAVMVAVTDTLNVMLGDPRFARMMSGRRVDIPDAAWGDRRPLPLADEADRRLVDRIMSETGAAKVYRPAPRRFA